MTIISNMEEMISSSQPVLDIEKPRVIWRQIADQMRHQILSGKIAPRTKLPSTAQIAKDAETDVKTVHRALSVLVKEGLLSRQRKVGTYVRERRKSLSPMGLYTSTGHLITPHRQFNQFLNFQVQKVAHKRGIKTVSWYDQRPDPERTTLLPEMENAFHAGKVNSLLVLSGSRTHRKWLENLPVPFSLLSAYFPNGVVFDFEGFLEKAIKTLRKKGCKSVSLISNLRPEMVDGPFADFCGRYGLAWRPRHIVHYDRNNSGPLDHFGYHGFKQLWRSPPHPDGIILYPDATISGLLIAALSAGIKIGRDVKLAVHRNKGMEFFCPVPASFIALDVEDCAEALIDQAQAMMEGKEPSSQVIRFMLEGR